MHEGALDVVPGVHIAPGQRPPPAASRAPRPQSSTVFTTRAPPGTVKRKHTPQRPGTVTAGPSQLQSPSGIGFVRGARAPTLHACARPRHRTMARTVQHCMKELRVRDGTRQFRSSCVRRVVWRRRPTLHVRRHDALHDSPKLPPVVCRLRTRAPSGKLLETTTKTKLKR